MKSRKRTWKVFRLSLGLALVVLSATNVNAQYDERFGLFGLGAKTDNEWFYERGLFDNDIIAGGIYNQAYGSDADGFGITNQTYGQDEDAPLGSGLLLMAVAGTCYAGMKRNKKQSKNVKQ